MKALFLLFLITLLGCSRSGVNTGNGIKLNKGEKNRILVAATDFVSTGNLKVIHMTEEKSVLEKESFPTHTDSIFRFSKEKNSIYVVNRLGQDNVQRLYSNLVPFPGLKQCSVQGRDREEYNLQDILPVDEENVIVTSLEKNASLLKVNLKNCEKTEVINFTGLADKDGIPEMTYLSQYQDLIYVILQKLDSKDFYRRYAGGSSIAVVDAANAKIVKEVKLEWQNPVTDFKKDLAGNYYVGSAGYMGKYSQKDGGIQKFSPDLSFSSQVITEMELAGDIYDFEILSKELAVALIATPKSALVAFNPTTGKKITTLLEQPDFTLVQVISDSERQLFYVADRTPKNPGVRLFSSTTLKEVSDLRWNVGLPPYWMQLAF